MIQNKRFVKQQSSLSFAFGIYLNNVSQARPVHGHAFRPVINGFVDGRQEQFDEFGNENFEIFK
jgi:hypothetical protein